MAGNLSPHLEWNDARTKWSSQINPFLGNPLVNGNLLNGIKVSSGLNTINHGLARKLQGYIVVGNNANVTFYDSQATNQYPDLTLALNSSGTATINLYVF